MVASKVAALHLQQASSALRLRGAVVVVTAEGTRGVECKVSNLRDIQLLWKRGGAHNRLTTPVAVVGDT